MSETFGLCPLDTSSYRKVAFVTAVVFPSTPLCFTCNLIKYVYQLSDTLGFIELLDRLKQI